MSVPDDVARVLPDRATSRRRFDRAAATFDTASVVHRRAGEVLLERIAYLRQAPRTALDLGCGTGATLQSLSTRLPTLTCVGLDSSHGMCVRATAQGTVVRAEATQLPFQAASFDLVIANLLLPWTDPLALFSEVARVLRMDGLFLFSSLGPDTLRQLRLAWARIDRGIHVHACIDMHDLGDLVLRCGLADPVLDVDRLTLTYPDVETIHADLRALGATNTAPGRFRGLTGKLAFAGYMAELAGTADGQGIGIDCELIFGMATGRAGSKNQSAIPGEYAVSVSRIGRSPLSKNSDL